MSSFYVIQRIQHLSLQINENYVFSYVYQPYNIIGKDTLNQIDTGNFRILFNHQNNNGILFSNFNVICLISFSPQRKSIWRRSNWIVKKFKYKLLNTDTLDKIRWNYQRWWTKFFHRLNDLPHARLPVCRISGPSLWNYEVINPFHFIVMIGLIEINWISGTGNMNQYTTNINYYGNSPAKTSQKKEHIKSSNSITFYFVLVSTISRKGTQGQIGARFLRYVLKNVLTHK